MMQQGMQDGVKRDNTELFKLTSELRSRPNENSRPRLGRRLRAYQNFETAQLFSLCDRESAAGLAGRRRRCRRAGRTIHVGIATLAQSSFLSEQQQGSANLRACSRHGRRSSRSRDSTKQNPATEAPSRRREIVGASAGCATLALRVSRNRKILADANWGGNPPWRRQNLTISATDTVSADLYFPPRTDCSSASLKFDVGFSPRNNASSSRSVKRPRLAEFVVPKATPLAHDREP